MWEKDDKRKRAEADNKKKLRTTEFLRNVVSHRENFVRFHRSRRGDYSRVARTAKLWLETQDQRREKEDAKAEVRRLQALKENDMDAYTKLVAETKNGRLKFLLNETDTYISTINRMIQQQQDDMDDEKNAMESNNPNKNPINNNNNNNNDNGDGSSSSSSGEKEAKKIEIVMQPSILKGGDLKEYQIGGLQWMIGLYNNNLNGNLNINNNLNLNLNLNFNLKLNLDLNLNINLNININININLNINRHPCR